MHAPEQEHRVHPFARFAALTGAAEVGHPDDDLAARRLQRDVASALILDRAARPLGPGAGLAPVLRVVEGGLRRLSHQEGRQSVGQCRDRALHGLEVFGGADHAPITAFGFDLLLDVLDLGADLREAIPRLLWGLLWLSPLAGFALGHGRSPLRRVCRETTIINERVGEEKPRSKAPILSDRSHLAVASSPRMTRGIATEWRVGRWAQVVARLRRSHQ